MIVLSKSRESADRLHFVDLALSWYHLYHGSYHQANNHFEKSSSPTETTEAENAKGRNRLNVDLFEWQCHELMSGQGMYRATKIGQLKSYYY